jgi:hypothetical protein
MDHWSDCAVHNAPALPVGICDCGGLNLIGDCLHDGIAAFVPGAGSVRILVNHMGRQGFIKPHQLPTVALAAIAAASDLEHAHDGIAILGYSNGMNLHDARIAVIAKLKALLFSQGLTGCSTPHESSPENGELPYPESLGL